MAASTVEAGERLSAVIEEHVALAQRLPGVAPEILRLATDIGDSLEGGGKLLVFGNGGSAADAQHFAAELTGRFAAERPPLAAIALTTDTSALTAIGNDWEFGEVFARQVRALAKERDVCVGISTSGKADNVVRGLEAAREKGATGWALTGGDGGRLAQVADRAIVIPSSVTARIQEMHITIIHSVCTLLDDRLAPRAE